MDRERAFEIVRSLAEGVDPVTGEIFPSDSPYSQAEVVRALYWFLLEVRVPAPTPGLTRKPPRPTPLGQDLGWQPWTADEDERIRTAWHAGDRNAGALAREHQRSRGAIKSRLAKLGLLEDAPGGRTGT